MKAAVIREGIVANVAEVADAAFADSQGWVVSDIAKIGDSYNAETGEFKSPLPPPPQVPNSVPALDALLALDAAGLSSAYEAWANDPARSFAERAFITKAQNWRRDDPTLQNAATALGLSSGKVDDLFIAAGK